MLYQEHGGAAVRVTACCQRLATAAAMPWLDRAAGPGIRPGMPLAEATALVGRAMGDRLRCEVYDPLSDRLALEELARWCHAFGPIVGLEDADPPESLLLDTSGLGRLFGGEPKLARRVVRTLKRRGLAARVAIADTPGAAWAMAHYAPLPSSVDLRDPQAILAALAEPIVVPPGQMLHGPLSVAALRLPEETCALLADLGLHRIEQLLALPRATLLARFGPRVLERLDQAGGLAPEAIVALAAPQELEFAWQFEHPTGKHELIEHALSQLIDRVCQTLAESRRGVLRLRCELEHEQGPADSFVLGLYRPSACLRHLQELARLKLESLRLSQGVSTLRVKVLASDRLDVCQQEMFDLGARREASRELDRLVDRLSNRLGSRAVVRPLLLAGAQPEWTCQEQPLAALALRRQKGSRGARPTRRPPTVAGERPLHLQPAPVPLAVMSVVPEGPPMQFRYRDRQERIVRAWGPERIETSWWRTRCVRRDYYQVETADGQRLWLFRELNSGQWFLHGEFI